MNIYEATYLLETSLEDKISKGEREYRERWSTDLTVFVTQRNYQRYIRTLIGNVIWRMEL